MVKHYNIIEGKIVQSESEDSPVSVYFSPTEAEKNLLTTTMTIDEHTLNSALDPDELSRFEIEPDHFALIIKRPKKYSAEDNFLFRVMSMGMFMYQNKIIIVAEEEFPLFDDKRFQRIRSLRDLMLKLVNRSVGHFIEHLRVINRISDELETHINDAMENKYLHYMFALEKSLVYYLNAISANTNLIQKLKNYDTRLGFDSDEKEFLDDLMIENQQCFRQAEIYNSILGGMMDARATIVGNNLNMLMKTLNIITLGIMVPTLVVSAFSMNVRIPLQGFHNAFWVVMGLAATSVVCFLLFWHYKQKQ
ncbi:MAG: magnesium transporter CorA family protein [Fibrobacteres bacterium]|nr:magnesium transporter CorA family protein [Fibrobacterota bacterium]